MKVIGISCWYHDSAVSYIENGLIKSAVQEERFSRKKHDPNFPINSLLWILEENQIEINDIDYIAYYEDAKLKLNRINYSHALNWPYSYKRYLKDMNSQNEKSNIESFIVKKLKYKGKFFICKHHLSHAASAFFPSPFSESAILTIDGVGEYETTTFGIGKQREIEIFKRINFPHSLGLLYSAFTYYCGFKINTGEYKLMGLAPYGKPIYVEKILKNLIDVKDDGSFRLNMQFFGHLAGGVAIKKEFEDLFQRKRREPESKMDIFYMNMAASIQFVIEEIFLKICRHVKEVTEMENLVLAGGVALNCVANGKLLKSNIFKKIWIQPASGDAGGALGAALYCANHYQKKSKKVVQYMNPYLGPCFDNDEIENYLIRNQIKYKKSENIPSDAAKLLKEGKILGWFQGKAEFGPRALGNRSILGNPLLEKMQKEINLRVKYRESFRPFAPVVLEDHKSEWFDIKTDSPYMLLVSEVKKQKLLLESKTRLFTFEDLNIKRSIIPSVTHVDCSARIQTVTFDQNPLLYELINNFKSLTNCPILINTSFNVRGEPIVQTPDDAYKCFMRTKIHYLFLGKFLIDKNQEIYKFNNPEKDISKLFPLD